MGGIGKTTVAKAVYNQIFHNFESSSFVADVSEVSKQSHGLLHLQEQLLSETLMKKNLTVGNTDRGINLIKERLRCKRVLVVLDDIDHLNQLNSLAGNHDWFGPGSRIIITTRDEHLLDVIKVDKKYKPKELNHDESLQLFSWHAFGKTNPIEDYVELSKGVVDYVGGLPLALEVLGSYLFGRSIHEWESAFEKLRRIPHSQIQRKLRISFDGLDDDELKSIFLDIACFFIGMKKDYAIRILNGCGISSDIGISVLTSRSLVTINENNELRMHDLLREMGRKIVREESPMEPGKRSRLWFHEDVCAVLEKHKGTKVVEGLILNLPISNEIHLSTKAFARMDELRLLQINGSHLIGSYEHLSKELRWLCWHYYPLKLIPSNFYLENLVVLDMQYSNITKVWKEIKFLIKLEVFNLSHSQHLIEIPDFFGLPNLEILLLEDCISLFEIHQSIGFLDKLVSLNLKDCKNLRNFPNSICKLKSLKCLNLSGCSKLEEFPESFGLMEGLTELLADGTTIAKLPFSFGLLKNLKSLSLQGCKKRLPTKSWFSFLSSCVSPRKNLDSTTFLPASILGLCSLTTLDLSDCKLSEGDIPVDLRGLSSLVGLDLSRNNFCSLPTSISHLSKLFELFLDNCTNIQSLPQLPPSLGFLHAYDCPSLERISNLDKIKVLPSVFLTNCTKLVEIQGLANSEYIRLIHERCNSLPKMFRKSSFRRHFESGRGPSTIVLPGSGIPNWFSHQKTGSSISFDMPSHPERKLHGFILWIVYAAKEEESTITFFPKAIISNKTKGVEQSHMSNFAILITCEDHAWVSYIPDEDFEYPTEVGDQVEVSIKEEEELHVKKCGIHPIYEQ